LSNALKFTDAGRVTLRVGYRFQVATFAIEDTGTGINAEDLERIFQPFERARSARARATRGTGLGLTITRLLTETLGGEITVESQPGKGSTFVVRLMLSEAAHPRTRAPRDDRLRGYVGPRRTILIVDDDETQRRLLGELLGPLGFTVLAAAGGLECLALAERHQPDLVLLDVSMPDIDGFEVARRLRRSLRERPAIVMLSALALDKAKQVEPDRVHDDYLMKPVDLRQVLERIHALLKIEWTYGPTNAPPSPAPLSGLPVPAQRDIEELIRLGQIGYVRGIREKLQEIAARSPAHEEFVAELRAIVSGFDLERYLATLEAISSSHA
jgi:CheY-like chemotaxis protein